MTIADELDVHAPLAEVWRAIEDPSAHAAWHPFVVRIEGEHRLGDVRSCAVLVGAKPGKTTERCVERVDGRSITWAVEEDSSGFGRMVEEWHAGFELEQRGDATRVTARSTFRPSGILVRVAAPIVRRKFHAAQRQILDALRHSVEGRARR